MNRNVLKTLAVFTFFISAVFISFAFGGIQQQKGYILQHENEIQSQQPGPHNGGGNTTAFSFFAGANDCKLVFRKRVLHLGAAIGYHFQGANEIYYIISGTGEMKMNGKTFPVSSGDAILTLPGSSHGLMQTGKEDLVMIINYEKQ